LGGCQKDDQAQAGVDVIGEGLGVVLGGDDQAVLLGQRAPVGQIIRNGRAGGFIRLGRTAGAGPDTNELGSQLGSGVEYRIDGGAVRCSCAGAQVRAVGTDSEPVIGAHMACLLSIRGVAGRDVNIGPPFDCGEFGLRRETNDLGSRKRAEGYR